MKRGMTMIELLIVVAVMVILITVGLPTMKTGIESARIKSAADIVRNQIRLAQSLAIEQDSATAVLLRASGASSQAVVILASGGLNYAGDTTSSMAFVTLAGPTGLQTRLLDGMAQHVVNIGDSIRFNHHWHRYRIVGKQIGGTPTVPVVVCDIDATPGMPPVPANGTHWPFVVYRQPEPSGHGAVSLPGSACVDLSGSGYGAMDDQWLTGGVVAQDVVIDVSPRGQVASVRIGTTERIPTEPIYLLIGEVDSVGLRVGLVSENATASNSRWVRISQQGQVSVLPNMWSVSHSTLSDSRGL